MIEHFTRKANQKEKERKKDGVFSDERLPHSEKSCELELLGDWCKILDGLIERSFASLAVVVNSIRAAEPILRNRVTCV